MLHVIRTLGHVRIEPSIYVLYTNQKNSNENSLENGLKTNKVNFEMKEKNHLQIERQEGRKKLKLKTTKRTRKVRK